MFAAIDVETTLNGNEEIGLAHPMHPMNHIVAYGLHIDDLKLTTYDTK